MERMTLRPGLLVHVSTSIKGNVKYSVTDLGKDSDGVSEDSRWQTDRHIADKAELEAATKARSKARSLISSVCAQSPHFLLCLESRADELDKAEAEARAVVAEFNRSAKLTQIVLSVFVGVVAPDDARAIRMVNQEMANLMQAMQEGMKNLDVKKIRDAADTARSVGQMLTPEMQAKIEDAIQLARKTAREMKKASEVGAVEIDRRAIAKIENARTAFLDLEDASAIGEVEHAGRAVELDPTVKEAADAYVAQARMFEV
jgi:hypothetical protein